MRPVALMRECWNSLFVGDVRAVARSCGRPAR
jgi:hypothetical protein